MWFTSTKKCDAQQKKAEMNEHPISCQECVAFNGALKLNLGWDSQDNPSPTVSEGRQIEFSRIYANLLNVEFIPVVVVVHVKGNFLVNVMEQFSHNL